jgi:hypothetical protein
LDVPVQSGHDHQIKCEDGSSFYKCYVEAATQLKPDLIHPTQDLGSSPTAADRMAARLMGVKLASWANASWWGCLWSEPQWNVQAGPVNKATLTTKDEALSNTSVKSSHS